MSHASMGMSCQMLSSIEFQPDNTQCQPTPSEHSCSLDIPFPHTVTSLGGVHSMLGLHDHGLIAVLRDSKLCIPDAVGSYKAAASFDTPFGRTKAKPVQYMESIWPLKPGLWISLLDEVPSWVPEKRNRISVDRTLNWLDECLLIHPVISSTKI